MATPAAADEVLFFIPDLGGFTKFIAETEIQHSQHIIQELLEILVDANTLGMKVSASSRATPCCSTATARRRRSNSWCSRPGRCTWTSIRT